MTETSAHIYPDLEFLGAGTRFAKDIVAFMNEAPMFQGLEGTEVLMIARNMSCYRAPKGEVLLREGGSGDFLLLLITGEVGVWKRDAKGVDQKLAVAKRGMTLGEMSLIDGAPRFASCVASTPVEFAVLKRADLDQLVNVNPRLCAKFVLLLLQMMTVRLREASARMLNLDKTPLA